MAGGVVAQGGRTQDLNRRVARLIIVIADLQRRIGVLESRPNRRGSSGMPGNQPHSSRQAPEKKEPRKPRRHGFARQRMTPTRGWSMPWRSVPTAGLT